jgi:hypothetical protein
MLKGSIYSMSQKEIEQSIECIKKWINSGEYRYDMSLLLNRLKDLQEIVEFGGME